MNDEDVARAMAVQSEAAVAPLAGAGFLVRAAAQLIDTVVHYVVWILSGMLAGVAIAIYSVANHLSLDALIGKIGTPRWYGYIAAGLGFTFYHAIMEERRGATLGKHLLGLCVVSTSGQPVRFRAALGRSASFFIDGLFLGLVALSSMAPPLQQRLGDQWFNTLVVKRTSLPAEPGSGRMAFLDALALGMLADCACYLVSACIKLN